MGLLRYAWLILIMGCASTQNLTIKDVYEKGYKDASKEQMDLIVERFNGGDFPYFYWNQPIIQNVDVPAHISNGVFVPAHQEIVIIKPGEWKHNAGYPIQSKEKVNDRPSVNNNTVNITPMPSSSESSAIN